MSKIDPRDAWAIFTVPTKRNHLNPTCGRIVVDTAERVQLHLNADPSRRLLEARKLVPDDCEDPALELHRAMLRLIVLDHFSFGAVFGAFAAVENFHESLADGRVRDPQRVEMG